MYLNQEQVNSAKQELLDIVWGNIEYDFKSIIQNISETLSSEYPELDEDELYTHLREHLDVTNLGKFGGKLLLTPTYKGE